MVVGVKGTGSIEERAGEMDRWLREKLPKGTGVNFVAHSMVSFDDPESRLRDKRSGSEVKGRKTDLGTPSVSP